MDFDCCSTANRKRGKGIKLPVDKQPEEIELPNKKTVKQCTDGAKKNHPEIVNCCYLGCLEDNLPFDDVKKIARLSGRYYYFCDEYCYLTWLLMPSLIWL